MFVSVTRNYSIVDGRDFTIDVSDLRGWTLPRINTTKNYITIPDDAYLHTVVRAPHKIRYKFPFFTC